MDLRSMMSSAFRVGLMVLSLLFTTWGCATDNEVGGANAGGPEPRPMMAEGVADAQPAEVVVGGMVRRYIGLNEEQCASIRFRCEPGEEYFADKKGCGCERPEGVVAAPPPDKNGMEGVTRTMCMPQDRGQTACTKEFHQVCGLFDPAKIQCIKAPCGGTYENPCMACQDDKVLEWIDGPCPL